MPLNFWSLDEAIHLCIQVEVIAPSYGCHVALTGGLLYQYGDRKDCDLLFYRIRQQDKIDVDGLFQALSRIGIKRVSGCGWVHKAKHCGKSIDCFFPEAEKSVCTFNKPGVAPTNHY